MKRLTSYLVFVAITTMTFTCNIMATAQNRLYCNDFVIVHNQTKTISLFLDNNLENITAFQVDLKMPQGITLDNVKTTERTKNHSIVMNNIGDGTWRIVASVWDDINISGYTGAVAVLTVSTDENFSSNEEVTLANIELSTSTGQADLLADEKFVAINYEGSYCGDNLYYRIAGDTLYIEGNGDMFNYSTNSSNRAPWYGNSSIKHLVMSDGIESIGKYAFSDCSSLESAKIGAKTINSYAFNNCTSLVNLYTSDCVYAIESNAFLNCKALKVAVLSDSVEKIGSYAFRNCQSLEYFSIGADCKTISSYVFAGCNLDSLVIFAATPPTLSNTYNMPTNVYVPYSSLDKYRNAPKWNALNIVGMEYTDFYFIDHCLYIQKGETTKAPLSLRSHCENPKPNLSWYSKGVDIVEITQDGEITGKTEGEDVITCLSNDYWMRGKKAAIKVCVTKVSEYADMNMDGVVNVTDVVALINYISTNDATNIDLRWVDMNEDGVVNVTDVVYLINYISNE